MRNQDCAHMGLSQVGIQHLSQANPFNALFITLWPE